mgnify:FL=1
MILTFSMPGNSQEGERRNSDLCVFLSFMFSKMFIKHSLERGKSDEDILFFQGIVGNEILPSV